MILRDLIAKLQEAPCGDPALDFWVWWWGEEAGPRGSEPEEHFADERILSACVPHYSSDLDIAAQLVPDGYHWRLEKHKGPGAIWMRRSSRPMTPRWRYVPRPCAAVPATSSR